MTRYSRWLEDKNRRETWEETVDRYIRFFTRHHDPDSFIYEKMHGEIRNAILYMDVMPSMRALMSAGPALEKENIAGFNCSYVAVNTVQSFSEILYVLMNGTGVGFSCERQEICQLPEIPNSINSTDSTIYVGDSKRGWAKALDDLLVYLYAGLKPNIDYSLVRPAGSRLRTFGGRASGPDPLKKLFNFITMTFEMSRGRKLTSVEVHDIVCMIGEIVVVGGVRRSALISLSNLSDQRMRNAKSGNWWESNPQRALANNSVAYTEKPEMEIFLDEWISLIKSKSGERGIFNRESAKKQAALYGRRPFDIEYGTNPCSEIILRDKQFCNLSEIIIRAEDTKDDIKRKVELATILGTFQATLTNFDFLSDLWKKNTEEEALLGVSMTGIMDNAFTSGRLSKPELQSFLNEMRIYAGKVNKVWAEMLGINPSAAITCVKPSGTVSQLCDTSSGIHARHNTHYIRTVRLDKKDPVYDMLVNQGIPIEDDFMRPDSTAVVSFPQRAPQGAVTRNDMSALEQLEMWLLYQRYWCEHKPSVTISVREDEWLDVGAWVYKHFDEVSGISFLPHTEHAYQQAPYQDMTPEDLDQWELDNPNREIDWSRLPLYEVEDSTVSSQTLACVAGSCEI